MGDAIETKHSSVSSQLSQLERIFRAIDQPISAATQAECADVINGVIAERDTLLSEFYRLCWFIRNNYDLDGVDGILDYISDPKIQTEVLRHISKEGD